jgi:hypothetical protein
MVEALRIGWQDLEQALAGDRAALVERRPRWYAGALLRVSRIAHPVLSGSLGSSDGVTVGSDVTVRSGSKDGNEAAA